VNRIRKAAVSLVKEEGIEGLNWRALGKRPELKITGTAPLYYFGSKAGLLGAVAEQGFTQLANRLGTARRDATPGADAIVKVSVEYARFGLENQRLYQAIHAAQLWHATGGEMGASKRDWIQQARAARDSAFAEFAEAVADAQKAGALKSTSTGIAARALTALIDGYLFQSLEENVDASSTLDERLAFLARLVKIVLTGLAAP
jgi:AcrR family transcriptional regulator